MHLRSEHIHQTSRSRFLTLKDMPLREQSYILLGVVRY